MKYAVYLFDEFIETVRGMDRESIEGIYPKSWGYRVVAL